MKSRLTFAEMQTFIKSVADKTLTDGFGYKQFYIDYFTAVLYGEKDFGGTEENPRDISEIYEELNKVTYTKEINRTQYDIILKAIEEEINYSIALSCKPTSNADFALATLIDKISVIVDKFRETNMGEVSELSKILLENKDNFTADKIVSAMKKNGIVGKKQTKPKKNVPLVDASV